MPEIAAPAARAHSLRGVGFLLAAFLMFALLDVSSKYLSRFYPIPGLVWARYSVHLLLMLILFGPRMRLDLVYSKRPRLQIVRGLLLLVTTSLFMTAIKYMPLAEASAIAFSSPLLLAILSGPLLGERTSRAVWIAVGLGLTGVFIILRPGGGLLTWAAVLPVAMAFTNSFYHILTRKLAAQENPATSLFYTALAGTVVMSAALPFAWVPPANLAHAAMIVGLGILGGGGHYLLFHALRRTQPSVLGPFSYVHLIWVGALGYLVFDEFPDRWALAGMGVIVASGIYVAFSEHARLRKRADHSSA